MYLIGFWMGNQREHIGSNVCNFFPLIFRAALRSQDNTLTTSTDATGTERVGKGQPRSGAAARELFPPDGLSHQRLQRAAALLLDQWHHHLT